MIDDWDNRLRDSQDYLHRIEDQSHFQETQMKKARAVYDAIRNKDDARIRQELGITPPDPSDVEDDSLGDAAEENRVLTIEEQFDEHARNLRVALLSSQFLPPSFTEEWVEKLREIDVNKPLPGLWVVNDLIIAYERVIEKFKPRRDIFDLAVSEEMRFDQEKDEIKRELDLLGRILQHVMAGLISDALRKEFPSRLLSLEKNPSKED